VHIALEDVNSAETQRDRQDSGHASSAVLHDVPKRYGQPHRDETSRSKFQMTNYKLMMKSQKVIIPACPESSLSNMLQITTIPDERE
jgi:hypothetical protein